MKVLIVCRANAPDNQIFDLKLHHAFIYEQVTELEKAGVTFDYFYIKGKGAYGYLKSILQLRKRIKTENIDLIHAHYGLSALVATFQRKIPVVSTFHGCDVNRKWLNLISSYVAISSKANIFVSENLFNKIFIKTPKKNYMIPCGLDLDLFQPIDKLESRSVLKLSPEKKYVLFASAKDVPVKNYQLAKLAADQIPDIELLEISGRSRKEVSLLMNACDVFLLTSFREGSPQTIKEAMACNCPIVSTDVGDMKSIISTTAGCFITSFDPADVAKKLKMALDYSQTTGRTNGRDSIAELGFDLETISGKILAVYEKAVGRGL